MEMTKKEEKKSDLEGLLNSLIEKGWKPFGIEGIKEFHLKAYECERGTNKIMIKHFEGFFTDGIRTSDHPGDIGARMYVVYGLKHITAKESGLRQFCIKNKLLKEDDGHIARIISEYKDNKGIIDGGSDYHYWLMICSILDEDELEDFLIDNIKI